MMKRSQRLPTKAEQQALSNWQKLNAKWDNLPKFARTEKQAQPEQPVMQLGYRSVKHHKSKGGMGNASKVENPQYTGTQVLGVAVMHKSSFVPVFSQEEAIDIANMRRNT